MRKEGWRMQIDLRRQLSRYPQSITSEKKKWDARRLPAHYRAEAGSSVAAFVLNAFLKLLTLCFVMFCLGGAMK
jgi:hypothetical protein